MADTYTLKYDFNIATDPGNYRIEDESGKVLFSGKVSGTPNNPNWGYIEPLPILRQLVKPIDYGLRITLNSAAFWDTDYVHNIDNRFRIVTPTMLFIDIDVLWNYSDADLSGVIFDETANYGVQDYLYTGQLFPLLRYNNYVNTGLVQLVNDNSDVLYSFTPNNAKNFYGQKKVTGTSGKLWWINEEGDPLTPTYSIRGCVPDNTVTLYFINKEGGLCWCHFDGNNTVTNNVARTQITHKNNWSTPAKFGIDNYHISNYKSYELNTDWLTDFQSEKIQDLFCSPKVWMYDYATDKFKSVIITDNSSTIKKYKNNKLFNYTVKCRESMTENIYA